MEKRGRRGHSRRKKKKTEGEGVVTGKDRG
jgi:hypothetical protein